MVRFICYGCNNDFTGAPNAHCPVCFPGVRPQGKLVDKRTDPQSNMEEP